MENQGFKLATIALAGILLIVLLLWGVHSFSGGNCHSRYGYYFNNYPAPVYYQDGWDSRGGPPQFSPRPLQSGQYQRSPAANYYSQPVAGMGMQQFQTGNGFGGAYGGMQGINSLMGNMNGMSGMGNGQAMPMQSTGGTSTGGGMGMM